MKIEMKIKGANDVISAMSKLNSQFREKVAWPAAVDTAELAAEFAKENAFAIDDPSTPNFIPANIAVVRKFAESSRTGQVIVEVGMLKGRKGTAPGGNTFYWWWTGEFGTKHQKARPFLRPAIEENFDRLFNEFYSSAKFQLIKLGAF